MSFLHGLELIPFNAGTRKIDVVRASVIGLVGIAPLGSKNTPIVVTGDVSAAQFGKELPGFTIPQALNRIFKQGAGTVIVINVFDPENDVATVTSESHVTAAKQIQLDYEPIGAIVVKNNAGDTTYVLNDDYTVDEWGLITIVNTDDIPNGTTLKVTYDKLDIAEVNAAQVIGTVSGGGVRTGIKAFYDAFSLFGFNPKILIAPGFITLTGVADELQTFADKFFGRVLVEKPVGTTTAAAITARGTIGDVFNVYSKRRVLLFPKLKAVNVRTEETENVDFAPYFAGVWARTITQLGYQYSPSNKPVAGIVGLEQPVSHNPLSPDGTDSNNLNSYGIVTVGNYFGQGLRMWGNRSSSYPTETTSDSHMSVMITADIIDESILQASLVFVDLPITNALIDSVRETVNAFLRKLIADGALIDGTNEDGRPTGCYFDDEKNTPEEIAAGHIVFTLVYCPPTPAERITYDRYIDTSFLASLIAQ